jgi:hypothetical protein
LKHDGPKVFGLTGLTLLGEEHKVGTVDSIELNAVHEKFMEEIGNTPRGDMLGGLKESRTEAIRAQASSHVHALNGTFDFDVNKRLS